MSLPFDKIRRAVVRSKVAGYRLPVPFALAALLLFCVDARGGVQGGGSGSSGSNFTAASVSLSPKGRAIMMKYNRSNGTLNKTATMEITMTVGGANPNPTVTIVLVNCAYATKPVHRTSFTIQNIRIAI